VDPQRVASVPSPRQPSLTRSLLVLAAALAALWPAFAGYGLWRAGSAGVLAALAAAVVCGIAAGVSLVMAVAAQRARQPISGVLGGMIVRMAVPLVAIFLVPTLDPVWRTSGFREMLLAYYLATLAVETWVLVRLVPADAASVAKAT